MPGSVNEPPNGITTSRPRLHLPLVKCRGNPDKTPTASNDTGHFGRQARVNPASHFHND